MCPAYSRRTCLFQTLSKFHEQNKNDNNVVVDDDDDDDVTQH